MRSFRSPYFEKAYCLLSQFIDETGRGDKQLSSYLEERNVDGLLAWADSHKGDLLAGPIRLFASGIMLDRTLDQLSAVPSEPELAGDDAVASASQLSADEEALIILANIPSPRWVH